jgi:uncharacterized protein YbjT (DUF2867 family)
MRTAVLFGSTGLVGRHCLRHLIDSNEYEAVISVGRSNMAEVHDRHRHVTIDFERLEDYDDELSATDVYCCLGTTIRKAGSREAFRKVDREYPRRIAEQAARTGARQFLIVTARGANASSPIFYNRVKGEVERDIGQVDLFGKYVFRPTLLLGDRTERRRGEKLAEKTFEIVKPLMRGPMKEWRPIHADAVAESMVIAAREEAGGFKAFETADMRAMVARSGEASVS